jgi:hypothetical protein
MRMQLLRLSLVFVIQLKILSLLDWPRASLSATNKIHLIIQYYEDSHAARQAELMDTLCRNICHQSIHSIHLLREPRYLESSMRRVIHEACTRLEHCDVIPMDKIIIPGGGDGMMLQEGSRLRFSEAIAYSLYYWMAHQENILHPLKEEEGPIFMISNSDIYFDETLHFLQSPLVLHDLIRKKHVYYLSRFEEAIVRVSQEAISEDIVIHGTQCGPSYQDSHDTFIFSPIQCQPNGMCELFAAMPLLSDIAHWELGSWGIENRIIYELARKGIHLLAAIYQGVHLLTCLGILTLNPCLSIRSWHHHASQVKHRKMPRVNMYNLSGIAYPHALACPNLY